MIMLVFTIMMIDFNLAYATTTYKELNPIYNVAANKEFTLKFKSNLNAGKLTINGYVKVYADAECTKEIFREIVENQKNKTITVKPPKINVAPRLKKSEAGGSGRSWGGYQKYYLVITRDMNSTQFKLYPKPLRMMFTVASLAEIPKLEFKISENGKATLYWNPVKGASMYKIYKSGSSNDWTNLELLATTSKTEYDDFTETKYSSFTANGKFRDCYYVSAVVNGKESRISDVINAWKLRSMIPSSAGDMLASVKKLETLPKTIKVYMQDYSTTKNYIVLWDYANVKYQKDFLTGKLTNTGYLDYTVPGTSFKGNVMVKEIDKNVLEELIANQNSRVSNSGVIDIKDGISDAPPPVVNPTPNTKPAEVNAQIPASEAKISLETKLTNAMLKSETVISLAEYPEAGDGTYLKDVFLKVVKQNPLILYVEGCSYEYKTKELFVKYIVDDKKLVEKKQNEIRAKVKEIVAKVIKPGMSDFEKEKALHDYIVENGEYDVKALKEAEKNNFSSIPKGYEDSFNPYGILVKGVGVCASYAGSLKLLCNEAKIDCVVVSGKMQNISHAWNKVKLDNMYYNVDATNNDDWPYAVFNAQDKTIKADFTENNDYELDSNIQKYASLNDKYDLLVMNKLTATSLSEVKAFLRYAIKNNYEIFYFRLIGDFSKEDLQNALKEEYDSLNTSIGVNFQVFASALYGRITK